MTILPVPTPEEALDLRASFPRGVPNIDRAEQALRQQRYVTDAATAAALLPTWVGTRQLG